MHYNYEYSLLTTLNCKACTDPIANRRTRSALGDALTAPSTCEVWIPDRFEPFTAENITTIGTQVHSHTYSQDTHLSVLPITIALPRIYPSPSHIEGATSVWSVGTHTDPHLESMRTSTEPFTLSSSVFLGNSRTDPTPVVSVPGGGGTANICIIKVVGEKRGQYLLTARNASKGSAWYWTLRRGFQLVVKKGAAPSTNPKQSILPGCISTLTIIHCPRLHQTWIHTKAACMHACTCM